MCVVGPFASCLFFLNVTLSLAQVRFQTHERPYWMPSKGLTTTFLWKLRWELSVVLIWNCAARALVRKRLNWDYPAPLFMAKVSLNEACYFPNFSLGVSSTAQNACPHANWKSWPKCQIWLTFHSLRDAEDGHQSRLPLIKVRASNFIFYGLRGAWLSLEISLKYEPWTSRPAS